MTNKWMSKGGLTAIAKDAFMLPINVHKNHFKDNGKMLGIIGFLPQALFGAGAMSISPMAGIITALVTESIFVGGAMAMRLTDSEIVWPNVTKFSDSLKPQNG